MDANEMRELLQGYLSEMEWGSGVTKDAILAHLAGRDETLRTMVNEYVAEGTYPDAEAVLSVLPAQAWQDAQGDRWRGAEGLLAEDTETRYQESPAGQDAPGTYRAGGQAPPTPGFGATQPEGAAGGGSASGTPGAGMASDAAMGVASGVGAGSVDVDVVVVGVDVDGDGAPDVVVADAIVYDETLGGGAGEGAGGGSSTAG